MKFELNPGIFRQYDIRGIAETDLNDAFAERLGQAYGTVIRRAGGQKIVIGHDCRQSGIRIAAAFQRGVNRSGIHVIHIGMAPTPLVYFSLHQLPVAGGVAITGSHNPPAWNGFKLCLGHQSMFGEQIQDLRRLMETGDFEEGSGQVETLDMGPKYQTWMVENLTPLSRPMRVVVDAGNGAGGILAGTLYRALGAEVIELFCEPDGRFPNHHPDPTVESNLAHLKAAVAEHKAELGIAFDGDADRIGAIDHQGRVVWGDQLLLFFGRAILAQQPGARFVGEVKCSRVLYDELRKAGGIVEMWKVGHSMIKARMKETGAVLAGEMSGHLFFADRYFGYDDAVYAGARLMELVVQEKMSLADMLDGLPETYTTPELRVACSDQHKFAVIERAVSWFKARYSVIDVDGARIDFPNGWGLIRASNTQPVLVMRFEADQPELVDEYRSEVEAWLKVYAPEVDLEADPNH